MSEGQVMDALYRQYYQLLRAKAVVDKYGEKAREWAALKQMRFDGYDPYNTSPRIADNMRYARCMYERYGRGPMNEYDANGSIPPWRDVRRGIIGGAAGASMDASNPEGLSHCGRPERASLSTDVARSGRRASLGRNDL